MDTSRKTTLRAVGIVAIVIAGLILVNIYFQRQADHRTTVEMCFRVARASSDLRTNLSGGGSADLSVGVIRWGEELANELTATQNALNDMRDLADTLDQPVVKYLLDGSDSELAAGVEPAARAFIPKADRFIRQWCGGDFLPPPPAP